MPEGITVEEIKDSPPLNQPTTIDHSEPQAKAHTGSNPELDVCRNESIFTNDPLRGGNLGYQLLHNLATPVDRPASLVGPVAAQHMHDLMKESYQTNMVVASGTELVEMYRYYQEQHYQAALDPQTTEAALKNAQKALDGVIAAKKKDDEELKALREKADKFKTAEEEIIDFHQQLEVKAKVVDRLPVVQKELDDAKGVAGLLKEKIQKMEADKPGIRLPARRNLTGLRSRQPSTTKLMRMLPVLSNNNLLIRISLMPIQVEMTLWWTPSLLNFLVPEGTQEPQA
uniref:Uncharacterized protein n=1 Tax=Chenopodium quinoa TaxID=63459 RepID=A0A803L728_CHEQI